MGVSTHSNFKISMCVEIILWFKENDNAEKYVNEWSSPSWYRDLKSGCFKSKDTKALHLKKMATQMHWAFQTKSQEYIPSYYHETLPSKPYRKQTIAS